MKKLLLACLALTLVLCLLPTTAEAATEGDYTYTISDGKATIIGYSGSGGDITIPSTLGGYPVTGIGDWAFSSCTSLESVTIPDSVTTIGRGAFYNCTSLESVTIGNSVESIGDSAFSRCTGLTGVYITDLAAWCAIDFSLEPLSHAENLYLNGSLVTELTIPDSVTTIGDNAFSWCESLTSVTIPDSVKSISYNAFLGCTSLTGIWVDENNTAYSSDGYGVLFNKDKTTLIKAPRCISGNYTIPNSVKSIGNGAFFRCGSLTSVTIGDNVESIGKAAFAFCTSLESVTIPVSVFSITYDAFKDVPLKTVHYGGTKEQWEKSDLHNNVCFASAEVKTTEPEKANHTIWLVVIIAISLALAGCVTVIVILLKKKKA